MTCRYTEELDMREGINFGQVLRYRKVSKQMSRYILDIGGDKTETMIFIICSVYHKAKYKANRYITSEAFTAVGCRLAAS